MNKQAVDLDTAENTGERVETVAQASENGHQRGFFNAIANRLAPTRLGDLLVDSGIISPEQLQDALSEQKNSRDKKLGQVLIETGAISAVTLYRKLAEQWTIKMAAAGITMMVSTGSFAPRSAHAETMSGTPAAYSATTTTNYKLDKVSYPALFGAREVRSNDISGFSNWTNVLTRFQRDLNDPAANQQLTALRARLAPYKNASLKDKVVAVNTILNARPYVEDTRNYRKTDYWATPVEFLQRGGDCEDYAIAKYASLRALGVPVEQMRLAIVMDKRLGIHHAILIVYDRGGKAYVLDNQERSVRDLSTVTRYRPIYSINQNSWWLHKQA